MFMYFAFPSGWWVLLGMIFIPYLILFFLRDGVSRHNEYRPQLLFAVSALAIAFLMEVAAVSLGLWNYVPGNWPIVLWPAYFGVGLLGYQIGKVIERR